MGPVSSQVKMGEGLVREAPHRILSLGIGSCVVLALYDTERAIGGLAHIMLPESASLNGRYAPYRCADTAIQSLLMGLRRRGAKRRDVVAKMAGGARMFSGNEISGTPIGEQNLLILKKLLGAEGIPLIGEDVGGHHGRNVEFDLETGMMIVAAIGKEDREF